jgi:hypothetical protein
MAVIRQGYDDADFADRIPDLEQIPFRFLFER